MAAALNILDTVIRRGTFTVFTNLVEGSLLGINAEDIDATKGIIHGIDSLLMPSAVIAAGI